MLTAAVTGEALRRWQHLCGGMLAARAHWAQNEAVRLLVARSVGVAVLAAAAV